MKYALSASALVSLSSLCLAQNREVEAVKDQYARALPSEKQLAFYSLDWSTDLASAKSRAAKEQRPIFFIYITNITAQTNFFSGHC